MRVLQQDFTTIEWHSRLERSQGIHRWLYCTGIIGCSLICFGILHPYHALCIFLGFVASIFERNYLSNYPHELIHRLNSPRFLSQSLLHYRKSS